MVFIGHFLSLLDIKKIQYVHWKSNTNIEKVIEGIDDLDLLVDPLHKEDINKIFDELGILRAYSTKDYWQNDIFHFIGCDLQERKLVHIHLHYALVLGFDYDKNFNIPIVKEYIKNRTKYKNIYLPETEKEYVILIIRLIIKNSLSSFLLHLPHKQIKLLINRKKSIVEGSGYIEFLDLFNKINRQKVKAIIEHEFKFISYSTFIAYEKIIIKNNSLLNFFFAARKLKNELSDFQKNNDLKSFILSFIRLNNLRLIRLFSKFDLIGLRKIPENGGRIIAFVGGDGAGKTTNIAKVGGILKKQFETKILHIGRPERSIKGLIIKLFKRITLLLAMKKLSEAIGYLALAYDRRSHFEYAKKLRNKGFIVLLDRIPIPGITAMDCPRINNILPNSFLSEMEKKIYEKITGADMIFVLKLDPLIAIKRRPNDKREELLERSGQIWDNYWKIPYAIEINTGVFSFEKVEELILENIWDILKRKYFRTEILGLNGAGKSSLLKEIKNNIPNVSISVPTKQYPFILFKNLIINFFYTLNIIFKTKNLYVGKNYIQFKTSLDIIEKWKNGGRMPSTNFILDQGVLFQYALMYKEKIVNNNKKDNLTLEKITGFFPVVFMLEAPIDILCLRTNSRPAQAGRGKRINTETFKIFCEDYQKGFNVIKKYHRNFITIDSALYKPNELYNIVYANLINRG
jgi:thymidylate kinase